MYMYIHASNLNILLEGIFFSFFFPPLHCGRAPGLRVGTDAAGVSKVQSYGCRAHLGSGLSPWNLFFPCETFLLRRGVFLWTTSVSLLTDKQVCRVFARALVFVFLPSKGSYRSSDFGTYCWKSRVIIISQGSDNVIGGPALSVRLELSLGLADAWSCLEKGGQDLCCAALCNFADIARQVTTQPLDGAALVYC